MTIKKFSQSMASLLNKFLSSTEYTIVEKKSAIDFYLHEYESYEQYKQVQIFHNKRKINNIWADEATMNAVAEIASEHTAKKQIKGVCHGARNGFEQNYLNDNFGNFDVVGTDISETATDYENSVQWDFHDEREEWRGQFDFVYSNSLDQAWKPQVALTTWLNQVRRNGVVIIEHTEGHGPMAAGEKDPFGVRPIAMPYVLSDWFGTQIAIEHTKIRKSNMEEDAWLFVCKKLVDEVK